MEAIKDAKELEAIQGVYAVLDNERRKLPQQIDMMLDLYNRLGNNPAFLDVAGEYSQRLIKIEDALRGMRAKYGKQVLPQLRLL